MDGERRCVHAGHLELFRNYDEHTGEPLPRMNTILVDSHQIESGTLDDAFKQAAAVEIERFRREKAEREGAAAAGAVSDSEILREVMNTVGRKGRLGEHVRCVVSVSMLTEGWDAKTGREASAAGHGGLALRGLHEVKEFPGQGGTPRLLTKASNCDRAAMSVSWLAALRQSASATYG